jgi:hypothetical protein
VATTASAKAVAPFVERVVKDWLDHMDQGRLHDPVAYGRDIPNGLSS